jgi:type II secretory pathway component PulF
MSWFFRNSQQLSPDEVRQLIERAVAVADTELPLASGLRAAATDVTSRRLRRVMQQLATQLDEGIPWPQLLSAQLQRCPADLRGTLHAALASGQVDEVLSQYVRQRAVRRDLVLSIRGTFLYPGLLMLFASILFLVFSTTVLPEIHDLLGDLTDRVESPGQWIFWWERTGVWWFLKALPVGMLVVFLGRLASGAARWQRFLYRMPLIGCLWQWLAVLEWVGMLRKYVVCRVPLPQAIHWASAGSPDANIRQIGSELASRVEAGSSMSQATVGQPWWPSMLPPLLRSAEQTRDLPGALSRAAAYYEERLQMRLALVRTVVPPLMFASMATGIILVFGAILMIVAHMVSWLS